LKAEIILAMKHAKLISENEYQCDTQIYASLVYMLCIPTHNKFARSSFLEALLERNTAKPVLAAESTPKAAPKWAKEVNIFMESNGLPRDCALWSGQVPKPLGLPSGKREIQMVDVAWAMRLKDTNWKHMEDARKQYYVDTHDSLHLQSWGRLKTMKQNSTVYSFEEAYTLTGRDHMRVQGWPSSYKAAGVLDKDFRSMAGEGFSLPCCMIAHMAYYLQPYACWWDEDTIAASGLEVMDKSFWMSLKAQQGRNINVG
jgi:hypothetical protein